MNRQYYERNDIVERFKSYNGLYGSEKRVISLYGDGLRDKRMLDIGVGAGRTTTYFAPLVREYVGIDYSSNMISACKERIRGENIEFMVCDARDMSVFESGSFDFVMFSGNGIDCLDHDGREKTLEEIRRVGKEGGHLFFSCHNIHNLAKTLEFKDLMRPHKLPWKLYFAHYVRTHNDLSGLGGKEHVFIREIQNGVENYTFYVRPSAQIAQLKRMGFCSFRAFSKDTGNDVDLEKVDSFCEPWFFVLCDICEKK